MTNADRAMTEAALFFWASLIVGIVVIALLALRA
jgi:hypothetical protein